MNLEVVLGGSCGGSRGVSAEGAIEVRGGRGGLCYAQNNVKIMTIIYNQIMGGLYIYIYILGWRLFPKVLEHRLPTRKSLGSTQKRRMQPKNPI